MIEPKQILPLMARVDLGVMPMLVYFTLFSSSELEPHNKMQFSVIPRILISFVEGMSTPMQVDTGYSKKPIDWVICSKNLWCRGKLFFCNQIIQKVLLALPHAVTTINQSL